MDNKEFTLEWESDEICQIARNGDYMGTDEVVDLLNHQKEKIQNLQERNNRQCELLEKQQEQIDNYIDIKAKLDGKIAEYTTKSDFFTKSVLCPIDTKIPRLDNLSVILLLVQSEPVTKTPKLFKISAIPLILIPPIPIICICLYFVKFSKLLLIESIIF